jgi:NADPH-dependent 2,4-dienoyl-CoA reductase/sulfur reductase-like enzyme/rhodanese-related sulfurtransferase
MSKKILIIGGVACGGKTAARLMRVDPEADITVLEKGEFLSYAGCGLPYYVGGVVSDYKELMSTPIGVVRDVTFFRKVKHVDVKTRHMATKIDRKNKVVTALELETGEEKTFSYDKLVIATGASPIRPPIPGIDLGNIFTLWNMPDALSMRSAIDSGKVKKAVIVGGGLIGMEVVEALAEQGLEVTVVDMMDRPLPALVDGEFGNYVLNVMKKRNIRFYGGEKVLKFKGDACQVRTVVTDKRELEADMVLMAIGVKPNTKLAKEAGIETGDLDAICVDKYMRTSDPDIYSGGDCCLGKNLVTGKPAWQPMGSTANREGRVIADNIAGRNVTFKGVQGTAIMKLFEYTIGKTGLSLEQAREHGIDAESVLVVDPDKPHFMPQGGIIVIKLVAEKKTRKVIGAQLFGTGKVDKRLDVLVGAVSGKMTIDDLADLDIAYAPPFTTALDPVTHAANSLKNKVDGLMKSHSPSDLVRKIEKGEDPVLVDLRSPSEIPEQGNLPYETLNIPLGQFWEKAQELPKDRELITYCKISVRGWDAYSILRRLGYTNIAVLEGGILGWPFEKKF